MLLILIIKVLTSNGAVQYVSLLRVYPHLLNTWDMILFSHLKDWELWKCYWTVYIIICVIVIWIWNWVWLLFLVWILQGTSIITGLP